MRRCLGALLAMVVLALTTGPAHGAAADYRGTARLGDCSAAVVRWTSSQPSDPARVLTNGHCIGFPFLGAREVQADRPSRQRLTLLDRDGDDLVTMRADRLEYATMWKTDAALYRLPTTYQELADSYGLTALTVAESAPAGDAAISIVSGYWVKTYRCSLKGFAHRLHERVWDWQQSLRYDADEGCATIGGTSGAPVLDADREVVGVNNTGFVGGEPCADTACEEGREGRVSVHPDRNYGQQTWWFTTCLGADRALDLDLDGCRLPAP